MPPRNSKPLTLRPSGCTDAIDGTNAPPGSMLRLANLVPSLRTAGYWEPRPARTKLASFYLFTDPGIASGLLVVGNLAYGMVPSLRNPGHDEPFVVDLTSGAQIVVSGVSNANTPLQVPGPFDGPWTPPILAHVASRIIVTHPGFPGGASNQPFAASFTANTHSGSPILDGDILIFSQLTPGTQLSDIPVSVPPGTVVLSSGPVSPVTTGTGTGGTPTFTVADVTDIAIGQVVSFADPVNVPTTVTGLAGNVVTIAIDLIDSLTNGPVYFSGGRVVMSQNAVLDLPNDTINASRPTVVGIKFGWFDISSYSSNTLTGDIVTGSLLIANLPTTLGLQPGLTIAGAGIQPGTRIVDLSPSVINVPGTSPNAGDTTLNVTFPLSPNQPLPFVPPNGAVVTGLGIATGTVTSGSPAVISLTNTQLTVQVTLGTAAVGANGAQAEYEFTFPPEIVMSLPAVATLMTVPLTIAGGTPTAPLWGSGDTAINHLPSNPVGVGQFYGRAYFACMADGIPFSDSGFPCVRTNADQALLTNDGLEVTAVAGLPLQSALTGGVTQALIAFEGATTMQEITGDSSLGTLAMNQLLIPSGTLAPLSISPSVLGLLFMSPEGMRVCNFQSQVGDPVGHHGSGVTIPFVNAAQPSRISIAANVDMARISIQSTTELGQPYQEWWYSFALKKWSGPHSLQTNLMQPWTDPQTGVNTFVTAAADVPNQLYRSDSYVSGTSSFEEDGAVLDWIMLTTLQPDNAQMAANTLFEMTLGMVLPASQAVTVTAMREDGTTLDQVSLPGNYVLPLWGSLPLWGAGSWYAVQAFFTQLLVPWSKSLDFKQMFVMVAGKSFFGLTIGNIFMRVQALGYPIDPYPAQILAISLPPLFGAVRGLIAPANSAPGTIVGPVIVVVGSAVILGAAIDLPGNPSGNLALAPFDDDTVTGDLALGSTAVTALSTNIVTEGWQVGYGIADTAGMIPPGTWIAAINPLGSSLTLSTAALGLVTADGLVVTGTNIVTNWPNPLTVETKVYGQVRAIAQGYTTAYLDFLVTVV